MAIETLQSVIPPPENARNTTGDWLTVETEIGITYPTDFREMIASYGTGEFFDALVIDNPLTDSGRKRVNQHLNDLRVTRDAMELSWMIHPEPYGLFPWGRDYHGNLFCWQCDGHPDEWPVVQLGHNEEHNPHHAKTNITTFLVQYLNNEYPQMLGGIPFEKDQHCFSVGLPWGP